MKRSPTATGTTAATTSLPKITPIRLIESAYPNYLFELKYDGFRTVAYIEGGTTRLVSRNGNTYERFDELCVGLASAAPSIADCAATVPITSSTKERAIGRLLEMARGASMIRCAVWLFAWAPGVWTSTALMCVVLLVTSGHAAHAGINVWTSHGPEGRLAFALAVDPTTPGTLYAGTDGAAFKSADGGHSWQAINAGRRWDGWRRLQEHGRRRQLAGNRCRPERQ